MILNKRKNRKKGSIAIEIALGVFFFIFILCAVIDVLLIAFQWQTVSQLNSYVSRTAGLQGGFLASAPSGYPGGNSAYIDSTEISDIIDKRFREIGVPAGEYSVKVGNRTVSGGGTTGEIDYGTEFDIEIDFKYHWKMISSVIPGSLAQDLSSTRTTISEFKYRYSGWVGE